MAGSRFCGAQGRILCLFVLGLERKDPSSVVNRSPHRRRPYCSYDNGRRDLDQTTTFRLPLRDRMRYAVSDFDAISLSMPLKREPRYPTRRAYLLKVRSDAKPNPLAGRLENLVTSGSSSHRRPAARFDRKRSRGDRRSRLPPRRRHPSLATVCRQAGRDSR